MAHSFTNLIYHLVFATKGRTPFLNEEFRPELWAYLGGLVAELGGVAVAVNGMDDHAHLLVKLRPDRSLTMALSDLKSRSSGWIHRSRPDLQGFAWQTGYGAVTVSASQVDRVRAYIDNQEEHHRAVPFDREMRSLLRKHGANPDDEWFWE